MGRFDALTQLEETTEPQQPPVMPVAQQLPSSLPDKPVRDKTTENKAGKKPTPSPVAHAEGATRPVKLRHGFDIYWDQYEALLELSTDERREGGTGSMSAMVREALDTFIAERRKK